MIYITTILFLLPILFYLVTILINEVNNKKVLLEDQLNIIQKRKKNQSIRKVITIVLSIILSIALVTFSVVIILL